METNLRILDQLDRKHPFPLWVAMRIADGEIGEGSGQVNARLTRIMMAPRAAMRLVLGIDRSLPFVGFQQNDYSGISSLPFENVRVSNTAVILHAHFGTTGGQLEIAYPSTSVARWYQQAGKIRSVELCCFEILGTELKMMARLSPPVPLLAQSQQLMASSP